jgi:hypothetical protein
VNPGLAEERVKWRERFQAKVFDFFEALSFSPGLMDVNS